MKLRDINQSPYPHRLIADGHVHRRGSRWDLIGMILSGLCLIHCLALPILLLFLPALQNSFISHELHLPLAVLLICIAGIAFVPGYSRHRDKWVAVLAGAGLILVTGAAFLPGHDHWVGLESGVTIFGSLLLISAHWRNRQLIQCCPTAHAEN